MGYLIRKGKNYTGGSYTSNTSSTLKATATFDENNFKKLARANNKTSTSNSFMNNLKSFANSRITKDNRPRYIMSRGY